VARIDLSDGRNLVLRLKPIEMLGAASGKIRVPISSVTAVEADADPWSERRGLRAPGTAIPGVIAYGTCRYRGGKDFALVLGRREALRVDLDSASPCRRLLVTVPDPRQAAAEVRAAVARVRPPT
jgi:hypothetical protein